LPAGGCASAPKLERVVTVFVEQGNALYAAMSSTATSASSMATPRSLSTYDAAAVETTGTDDEARVPSPVGVARQTRPRAGAHCKVELL
jgi:hypothetical protein